AHPARAHRPRERPRRAHGHGQGQRRATHVVQPALPALPYPREGLRLPLLRVPAVPRGLSARLRRPLLPDRAIQGARARHGAAPSREARAHPRGRRRGRGLCAAARAAGLVRRNPRRARSGDVRVSSAVLSDLLERLRDLYGGGQDQAASEFRLTERGIWHPTPLAVLAAAVPLLAETELVKPRDHALQILDAGAGDGRLIAAL